MPDYLFKIIAEVCAVRVCLGLITEVCAVGVCLGLITRVCVLYELWNYVIYLFRTPFIAHNSLTVIFVSLKLM